MIDGYNLIRLRKGSFTEFKIISRSLDDFPPKEGMLRTSFWYDHYLSTEN